jgi:hypothetical protein
VELDGFSCHTSGLIIPDTRAISHTQVFVNGLILSHCTTSSMSGITNRGRSGLSHEGVCHQRNPDTKRLQSNPHPVGLPGQMSERAVLWDSVVIGVRRIARELTKITLLVGTASKLQLGLYPSSLDIVRVEERDAHHGFSVDRHECTTPQQFVPLNRESIWVWESAFSGSHKAACRCGPITALGQIGCFIASECI